MKIRPSRSSIPTTSQFTFAPRGPRSLRGVESPQEPAKPVISETLPPSTLTATPSPAIYRPTEAPSLFQPAQYRPNPRGRIGGNGGPPLNDPMTLQQVFPGLTNAPGGSLLAIADNILDLSGPATRLTTELSNAHANILIDQIRTIDLNYRLDTLGFPTTPEGQANLIRQLRMDRATAFYRRKNEAQPLQVETLRLMQERADIAYDEGVALYNAGRLNVRLSREEAIGNYVDGAVRRNLRKAYNEHGIDTSMGQPVRVNRPGIAGGPNS